MAITLQGWSFNNDGSPAPNLVVTCYDQTPNQVGLTSTNSAGFWQFTGLTSGITYDVKINNNGVIKWIKGGEAHQASSLNLTSPITFSGAITVTGLLTASGDVDLGTITQSTSYTVPSTISWVFCTAAITITLPDPTITKRTITVDATTLGSGSVTVVATGGSTVFGGSFSQSTGLVMNGTVSAGDSIDYHSNGTNWRT